MKKPVFVVLTLLFSIQLCAQQVELHELISKAYYHDTVVFQIDASVSDGDYAPIKNCPKIGGESVYLFYGFSGFDCMKSDNYYLYSAKQFGGNLSVLTIIGSGKYSHILYLLTFQSGKLASEMMLESSFIDAGQVEIYSAQTISTRQFTRSFYMVSERYENGKSFSISDSTILTMEVLANGLLDTLNLENFRERHE